MSMATTSPIRIDDELYKSASIVGPVMSRSASQQVQHWARIGREIEEAGMAASEVAEVLAGARSYDDLDARQQAMVRAEWQERIEARLDALDLAAEFEAAGESYAELDDDGNAVVREPTAS
jgi:hypothetical protein